MREGLGQAGGGVCGDGGAVVGEGAEEVGFGLELDEAGVEGGLFADLESEEVGGTLVEACTFGFFELFCEFDIAVGLFDLVARGLEGGMGVLDGGGDLVAGELAIPHELGELAFGDGEATFGFAALDGDFEIDAGFEFGAVDVFLGLIANGLIGFEAEVEIREEVVSGEALVDGVLFDVEFDAADFGAEHEGFGDVVGQFLGARSVDGRKGGGDLVVGGADGLV